MHTVGRFIRRTLTTRVTPLAYLVAIESMVYGFAFAIAPHFSGADKTILFKTQGFAGTPVWGFIILVGGLLTLVGMLLKNKSIIGLGSGAAFMSFFFAAMIYFQGDLWFQLSIMVIHILMYGYIYLASSMDQLWDFTPNRD